MKINSSTTDYGNWISSTLMSLLVGIALVLASLLVVAWLWLRLWPITLIIGLLFLGWIGMTAYMYCCRRAFSFTGGGLMGKMHGYLLEHFDWDGEGRLLDIGCGSGALSIRCAKKFHKAKVTGIDYWGLGWNYGQEQCETNAKAEGVADRTQFLHGDAAQLNFPDATFDAVVSNFVFHEVRTQPDKQQLIREALRVLRPGGSFALQDLFDNRSIYGDINELIRELQAEGYEDICYESHVECHDFVPAFLRVPWMFRDVGLIHGRKPE